MKARLDCILPHSLAMPAIPILVWMDDLCIGLTGPDPPALVHEAGVVTSLLLETLEGYGMTPNLRKGKTESADNSCLASTSTMPIICESGIKHVSIVGQYQHLGGIIHHAGDNRIEMKKVGLLHMQLSRPREEPFFRMQSVQA